MKKNLKFLWVFVFSLLLFSSCNKKDEPKTNPNQYVNDWIYNQMSVYYLWNNLIPVNPDYTPSPDNFFKSLLNTYNKSTNPDGDRFSWIQENYIDLLNSLSGVSSDDLGFEYVRVQLSGVTPAQYYLLVLYPKLGSDAYNKGISRGRFIIKINNQNIYDSNYSSLTSGTGNKTLSMADFILNSTTNQYELKSTGDVVVKMESNFAEIPVYKDSVYTLNNGKKVGYLVYNFFATDKGDDSYTYDKLLMNTLSDLKTKAPAATDFVLDLRYNSGGAVSSAIALASALVNNRSTQNVITTSVYNSLVDAEFRKQYGNDYNKDYFIDQILNSNGNPVDDVPSLNIQNLYILVSNWTASASELIINGLKPYINVKLIGETTYGKNVGSISLYETNDEKNKWGMQPIVVRFYNSAGSSNYSTGFVPDYEIDEFSDNLHILDFGDVNEKLLNKALTLINGGPLQVRKQSLATVKPANIQRVPHSESFLSKPERNVMIDDVRGEQIKKIMKKYVQ